MAQPGWQHGRVRRKERGGLGFGERGERPGGAGPSRLRPLTSGHVLNTRGQARGDRHEVHLLSDAEEDVRSEATNGLIDFAQRNEDAARVVSVVAETLRGGMGPDTRVAALRVLGAIGRPARVVAPAIAGLLYASSSSVRAAATVTLADVGANDSGTISALARMAGDHDSPVREAALSALMQLAADPATVLPVAIPALVDTLPAVREQAAYTLGALRPVPGAAIAQLAHVLRGSGGGCPLGRRGCAPACAAVETGARRAGRKRPGSRHHGKSTGSRDARRNCSVDSRG